MKINKPILAWNQEDTEMLRDDPYNLEDLNIEYKEQYSGDANELRRDIVSFANSKELRKLSELTNYKIVIN